MSITVRVITPDRIVWDNVAEEVILPSSTGQLGILSGHAPLLTALNIGVMRIRPGKDWENIAVLGGFAEVENNEIKVLVNGAELGSKIDKVSMKSVKGMTVAKLSKRNNHGAKLALDTRPLAV